MIDKANQALADVLSGAEPSSQESHVGQQVRQLRMERGLSIRGLAEISGLSVNTLSLIENGKISPSVSTLQRAAAALSVSITAFFETPELTRRVVFSSGAAQRSARFEHGAVENLAPGFTSQALHPCLVTLEPHTGSGADLIVHTGYEFAFCLRGQIAYTVDNAVYTLAPGDSVIFESHLPHRWQNETNEQAQMLVVLAPTDERDRPTHRHFTPPEPSGRG